MIKDRPHRLGLIYVNQPLYFVTFATRDRKRIPSLHRAQLAHEQYGHCATAKFNVALGRYVIMPAGSRSFVCPRRSTLSTLIVDRWFEARDFSGAIERSAADTAAFTERRGQRLPPSQ